MAAPLVVTSLLVASCASSPAVSESLIGRAGPGSNYEVEFTSNHDFAFLDQIPDDLWASAGKGSSTAKAAIADRFVTDQELEQAAQEFRDCVAASIGSPVGLEYFDGVVSLELPTSTSSASEEAVESAQQQCFDAKFGPLAEIRRLVLEPSQAEVAELEFLVSDCRSTITDLEEPERTRFCNETVLRGFNQYVESAWLSN